MIVRTRTLAAALLAAAAAALIGCGSGGAAQETTPSPTTSPRTETAGGARLARVRGGLGDALYVTGAPGQPNRLFIVQQSGRILVLDHGRLRPQPFLDVSRLISSGGERGLLGLAFHPGYASNGRFYIDYTNRAGDTRVVEYRRSTDLRADPGSARVLLKIKQPFPNHNGGSLQFGPDGDLYVGMGDGGGGGDPLGNGQNVNVLLGKLLRIDVDSRTGSLPYGIPAGNPFASGGGRPEIYAYGLRNPWRFSFDRTRGDLWIGDVGQDKVEEIDYRPKATGAGVNFGWNAFEGRSPFKGAGAVRGVKPTPPVAQYTHALGCSVTGGYVYRGTRARSLIGRYVFADYCTGRVWSMRAGPDPGPMRQETGLGPSLSNVTSFGESLSGDLFVIAGGALYRFVGR